MARKVISSKRIQIDKSNSRMVASIAIASFVTVFSLVSVRALSSQASYQNRVIDDKQKAVDTLKGNLDTTKELVKKFEEFNSQASLLGGQGGIPNAQIVLDALPSKYDFPALATSLEKILTNGGYKIESISGTDDEVNQTAESNQAPEPVEMPFGVNTNANYIAIQKLVADLERSIRPFNLLTLNMSGNDNDMKFGITAVTYYQPVKTLDISMKVVK